ncbi:hypothetical protein ACVBE9_01785 [Eionea flava]
MKFLSARRIIITTGIALLSSNYAIAHSPELHRKENAEKPNCEAMKNMDHGKMDMSDPVIQAMIKQCMTKNHNDDTHKGMNGHHDKKEENHGNESHDDDVKKSHQ